MDVTVRKTNGSFEEYDKVKLMNGIREAYKTAGEECPEAVVVSIAENLYIYDKITSREIRRQVEESLMSINNSMRASISARKGTSSRTTSPLPMLQPVQSSMPTPM